MKKLNLLIVLILCVCIGGVYAIWYYSGAENVADVSEPITINLEDAQTVGSHGSYTLSKTLDGETFFRIDQLNDDHEAVINCKGKMLLLFTPSEHASAEIKGGQFDTWIYFSGNLSTLTYNGQQIFVDLEHVSYEDGIKVTWTVNEETEKLECDITDYIAEAVQFNSTFKLDTLAEYNAFSTAISSALLTVHVTDGIIAESPST